MPGAELPAGSGRYAYDGLDRTLHEKARLGILTCLVARPGGLAFNQLKQMCALTDGNLHRHLQVLFDEGMIEARKESGHGRPRTLYRLTAAGRRRFLAYLAELERVVRDALASGVGQGSEGGLSDKPVGWVPA